MGQPSKSFPIDATGRVLITEAADTKVATAKITVGTSATTLTTNTTGLERRKLFIRNEKSSEIVVFVGDANVTTSTGFPLYRFDELELDVDNDTVVKAIRADVGLNDGELRIMEVE